jgi:hypothetical protein
VGDIKLSREELYLFPKIYMFYRQHPVLAVRDLLGITLSTHQRLDLRLNWHTQARDIIRIFSRGMSKTFGEAVFAIISAVLYPRLKVLSLGAEGFRQGKMILEEAESIIKGEKDGQKQENFIRNMVNTGAKRLSGSLIRKDPDLWKIEFLNGSAIATAPLGNKGDAIRGFRANITQIDERRGLKKEIKDRVIRPFSIIDYNVVTQKQEYENKNIDSGTLQYEEDDYTKELEEYMRLIKEGKKEYLVVKFIYADAFDNAREDEEYKYNSRYFNKKLKFWSVPYGIKVNDIEGELDKITTDTESWRSEHLCVPMRATGDYYSFELVNSVANKRVFTDQQFMELNEEDAENATMYLRPKLGCKDPCILSVDVAREHDMTSFVVTRLGPLSKNPWDPVAQEGHSKFCNVIWAYEQKFMQDTDAAIKIYEILDMFEDIRIVALDKRGGGSSVRDQLYRVVKEGIVDDYEILFDPEDNDEGGIATLLKDDRGGMSSHNDRLRLVSYSDEENTKVNRSLKTAMGEERFYFCAGDEKVVEELKMVRAFINVIPRQFRMIQIKPTKNWLNFSTPDPDKDLKDMYSATIYGWGEIMKLIHEEDLPKPTEPSNLAPTITINRFRNG